METLTALEDEIIVHLPAGRVWDLLTDWAAAPAWLPGVEEMHVNGPVGPGQEQVLPVLIHGDAAFAGQGIVWECLGFSGVRGLRL